MKRLPRVALAVLLTAAAGSAAAEDAPVPSTSSERAERQPQDRPSTSPVQMVRTLQLMQDQIASGSVEAHVGQRGLLAVLDERFMGFEPETWRDSRNARAAVAFALSGGKPQILRKILGLGAAFMPADDIPLIEGALAYVEGREEEARRVLLPINAQSLPASLSGQVALVQSALVVRTDPAKSVELLDFVRLQAPGTLLEEAALRRQVFVVSQIDNSKKFESLVHQYLRRYRHSIYAGNFRQRLASALTRIDFGKDPARLERMAAILAELGPEVRRELYLLAAQASIEQGFTKSAFLLAEKAQELSEQDPESAARVKLYRAAAMIVSPETLKAGISDLQTLDRSAFAGSDAALLRSALAMADQILKVPGSSFADQAVTAPGAKTVGLAPVSAPTPASTTAQAPEQPAALLKARDALSRVDKLIKTETR